MREDSRFVARQSVAAGEALVAGPVEHRLAERPAGPQPAGPGKDRREAEEAGLVRPGERGVRARLLQHTADGRPHHPALVLGDEVGEAFVIEALLPVLRRLLQGRDTAGGEDGRQALVPGQHQVELGEHRDVLATSSADTHPVGLRGSGA